MLGAHLHKLTATNGVLCRQNQRNSEGLVCRRRARTASYISGDRVVGAIVPACLGSRRGGLIGGGAGIVDSGQSRR